MPALLLTPLVWIFAVGAVPAVESAGLPNRRVAAPDVLVGGAPIGERAWRELKRLGVRTVVGVDGPPPAEVASAHHAIRVVHVPLGYHGIPREQRLALVHVAREAERPIYVCCHHGKHRGPAAAAIVCQEAGLLDSAGALELLRVAGTDPAYGGLWRDVEAFESPPGGTPLPPLVSAAEASPLALAMAQLDRSWDLFQESGPTGAARAEAVAGVAQALRESRRAVDGHDSPLPRRFDEVISLFDALSAGDESNPRAFEASCVACHAAHRD